MQHRTEFARLMKGVHFSHKLHIINEPVIESVALKGKQFLKAEGYSDQVAEHTRRSAQAAALAIGRPDVLFLGLLAEYSVGKSGSQRFAAAAERFYSHIQGKFDESTERWITTSLALANPTRIGALISLDRDDNRHPDAVKSRKQRYEEIVRLATLEPILRLLNLADVGSFILEDPKTLTQVYSGRTNTTVKLDPSLPLRYATSIGSVYLPIAEKNGMHPTVDALCKLLSFGASPEEYFKQRDTLQKLVDGDLQTIKATLMRLKNNKIGRIREAQQLGDYDNESVEIGIKGIGRTLYKINFDGLPRGVNRDDKFVIANILDLVRARVITGPDGDPLKAMKKLVEELETSCGFKLVNEIISRKTEYGEGGTFVKANLTTPPINGRVFTIELQAVPEEMMASMADGVSDHAQMQALKHVRANGIGSDALLSPELMRQETARKLAREEAGLRRGKKSSGRDELPKVKQVLVRINDSDILPTLIYDGATVADAMAQHLRFVMGGVEATINGQGVKLSHTLGIRDQMIQVKFDSNSTGMGIDRALALMDVVVMPEAFTQLAGHIFETTYQRTNGNKGSESRTRLH